MEDKRIEQSNHRVSFTIMYKNINFRLLLIISSIVRKPFQKNVLGINQCVYH